MTNRMRSVHIPVHDSTDINNQRVEVLNSRMPRCYFSLYNVYYSKRSIVVLDLYFVLSLDVDSYMKIINEVNE